MINCNMIAKTGQAKNAYIISSYESIRVYSQFFEWEAGNVA